MGFIFLTKIMLLKSRKNYNISKSLELPTIVEQPMEFYGAPPTVEALQKNKEQVRNYKNKVLLTKNHTPMVQYMNKGMMLLIRL